MQKSAHERKRARSIFENRENPTRAGHRNKMAAWMKHIFSGGCGSLMTQPAILGVKFSAQYFFALVITVWIVFHSTNFEFSSLYKGIHEIIHYTLMSEWIFRFFCWQSWSSFTVAWKELLSSICKWIQILFVIYAHFLSNNFYIMVLKTITEVKYNNSWRIN